MKTAIHDQCVVLVASRIAAIQASIAEARYSAQSDTKSSAGDKHETGRAMAQLEIDKQSVALANLQVMQAILERMDPTVEHTTVTEGALVHLDTGILYIAISLGKVPVDDIDVQVISAQAPLAVALRNMGVGGKATFNGLTHTVLAIA